MSLIDQRCANHALREAAVQCPSCKRYFCRECVTEHQGRMMCVSCVTLLSRGESKTARTAATVWSITAIAGILIAWLVFYYLGQTLAKIPSEFHGASDFSHRSPYREKWGLPSLSRATMSRSSANPRRVDRAGCPHFSPRPHDRTFQRFSPQKRRALS